MNHTKDDCQLLTIVHIHSADSGGGAEVAAYQLHMELKKMGHNSIMFVGRKEVVESDTIGIPCVRGPKGLLRFTKWLERQYGLQYLYSPGFRQLEKIFPKDVDVIHFHSLHGAEGYADIGALPRLSLKKPAVMMMHDMWMLTGHCGFPTGCDKWLTGCGSCPDLSLYPAIPKDGTRINWLRKRKVLSRSRLSLVATSNWLTEQFRQSPFVKGRALYTIPNSVDTTIFQPGRANDARARLGISEKGFVALLMANQLSNRWKGIPDAIEALNRLNDPQVTAVLVGQDCKRAAEKLRIPSIVFPHMKERNKIADVYRASDVLVMPSLEEVFGMVAAESMACGTPVIAYATGGLPEVLGDNEGGILVARGDIAGLADAIMKMIDNEKTREELAEKAAERALRLFSLRSQAEHFITLYRSVISERGK